MMKFVFFWWGIGCTPKTTTPKVSTSEQSLEVSPKTVVEKNRPNEDCGSISGLLLDIATAEDPTEEARLKQLLVHDSFIRVLITVAQEEPLFWLEDESAIHELSLKDRHQILIEPKEVCVFSSDSRIQSIAIPNTPSPKK